MKNNINTGILRFLNIRTAISQASTIHSSEYTITKIFLLRLGLVLAALLIIGSTAQAAFYVRAGSTGANNGADWTNARTSLPSTLVRGETYYVASGSYGSYDFANTASGTSTIIVKKATTSDHGTSTGWSDSYATGQAVWTYWGLSMSYLTIDGQTGGGPGSWETGHGIAVRATSAHILYSNSSISFVTLKHIEIDGINTAVGDRDLVYLVGGTTDLTMQYMYIHDVGCDMFQLRGNHTRFTLEYSELARNNMDGACHGDVFEYDSGTALNWIHRYNYFKDVIGTYLWGSHESGTFGGAEIYGNIISGGGFTNGMISGLSGGGTITNLKFYNNTVSNVSNYYNAGFANLDRGTNNVIYNNMWYNSPANMGGNHDYNWFYGSSSQSESHIQNGSGNPFVNIGAGNFRLTSATSAGISLSSPYNSDMLSLTRGADGIWDRGALEYGTLGKNPTPPSSISVSQ